jgi:feruloyl esterase
LRDLRLPDVRIVAAEARPRDTRPGAVARVPHCLVSGVIGREIRFWVWLPDRWNQRFFMGGAGGFAGRLDNQALASINEGYATAATDTGHDYDGIRAGWALDDLERQLNYGHLAMHRTTEVAKAVIRKHYGRDPVRSYFFGCSNGGRQALMEAQRYPGDYDGIVSGAPAISITRIAAGFVKNIQASFPDPSRRTESAISSDNLRLLETRVLAACDALDGVRDSVVGDPPGCAFQVASLPACPGDQAGPGCLTRSQRAAIERVYTPITNQDGVIYPGQPVGGENWPTGWGMWLSGVNQQLMGGTGGAFPSLQFAFGTEFFKYFVFADSTWDYSRYDFSTWHRDTRLVSTLIDAGNPDLSAFKARGGKLILWHGWADPGLNALETIDYYREVEKRDPAAREFARLFLLPGVMHCYGGPGPDRVNWFGAVSDWVEHSKPPEHLVATKADTTGKTMRTRPICPHPLRAVYRGHGSIDNATNFSCGP